jgi:hypothetical protein
MKINILWIVEFPKLKSELVDILTRANLRGLDLQFKGGLSASDIHSVWTDESEAVEIAQTLIRRRNDAFASGCVSDAEIRDYCEAVQ